MICLLLGTLMTLAPAPAQTDPYDTLLPVHDLYAERRTDGGIRGHFYLGKDWFSWGSNGMPKIYLSSRSSFGPNGWAGAIEYSILSITNGSSEGARVDFETAAGSQATTFIAVALDGYANEIKETSFAACNLAPFRTTEKPELAPPAIMDGIIPITLHQPELRRGPYVDTSTVFTHQPDTFEANKFRAYFSNAQLPRFGVGWQELNRLEDPEFGIRKGSGREVKVRHSIPLTSLMVVASSETQADGMNPSA
jgi:hypothetical protein